MPERREKPSPSLLMFPRVCPVGRPDSPVTSDNEWLSLWGKGSKAENSTRQGEGWHFHFLQCHLGTTLCWGGQQLQGEPLSSAGGVKGGSEGPETEIPPGSSALLHSSQSRPQTLALSLKLKEGTFFMIERSATPGVQSKSRRVSPLSSPGGLG